MRVSLITVVLLFGVVGVNRVTQFDQDDGDAAAFQVAGDGDAPAIDPTTGDSLVVAPAPLLLHAPRLAVAIDPPAAPAPAARAADVLAQAPKTSPPLPI